LINQPIVRVSLAGLLLALVSHAHAQDSYYEPRGFAPQGTLRPAEADVGATAAESGQPRSDLPSFPFRHASASEPSASEPTAAMSKSPALKLAPRGVKLATARDRPAAPTPSAAVGTVASSLAIVLGLFVVLLWISKRFAPAGTAPLPKEAVELLGRATLTGRQTMQLIRVGNRLLLVALSAGGAETLTEITDPVEVEHLAGLCRHGKADSASASFNRVLSQLATEPTSDGQRPRTRGAA
jgi:flagellar biogenesis protein FliO